MNDQVSNPLFLHSPIKRAWQWISNASIWTMTPVLMIFILLFTACTPSLVSSSESTPTTPVQPVSSTSARSNFSPGSSLYFTEMNIEEGLSQSVINAILQDQRGFIWFGTQDGLNRYDGYTFKIFKPDSSNSNSLSDRWITSLLEDTHGNLWIGTRQGGVNILNPQTNTFTHYMHDSDNPASLLSNLVNTLYEDQQGMIWVGTSNGLDMLNPVDGTIQHIVDEQKQLDGTSITSIAGDSTGRIWLGTSYNGIFYWDPISATVQYGLPEKPNATLCSSQIIVLRVDDEDTLWAGTNKGLNRYSPQNASLVCYTEGPELSNNLSNGVIKDIFIESPDTIWIATISGLNRLDQEKKLITQYLQNPLLPGSLTLDNIETVYVDREGVLWIGTYGGGLNKTFLGNSQFAFYRNDPANSTSLSSNMVFPILADQEGNIWVGTEDGGLNKFDPETGQFVVFNAPGIAPEFLKNIWTLFQDRRGGIWIGSASGLVQIGPRQEYIQKYVYSEKDPNTISDGEVMSIHEDSKGNIWVGTSAGLNRLDPVTKKITRFVHDSGNKNSIGIGTVTSILEMPDQRIWVGTFTDGLHVLDPQTGVFTHYRWDAELPSSLSNNSILDIYRDSRERIWIATAGGGLNRYDPNTDSFVSYTEKNGMPNDVIYGILEDKSGRLWLSTNKGIARFNPETLDIKIFNSEDGLIGSEFNMNSFAIAQDGTMYFGGIHGLNSFHPEEISDNPYSPPVVLTSFTQEDQPIDPTIPVENLRSVTLNWSHNSFDFEFSALSFSNPKRNQYAYRLENFDTDWNMIGNRRYGKYTNLSGGTYTLQLKAANADGVWGEPVNTVQIIIHPPFWQLWWVQVVSALFLVSLVFGGYQLRSRAIRARNQQLKLLVAERTQALEHRNEQMEALYQADEKMLRYLKLDQALAALIDIAVDLLHADQAVIFLWETAQEKLMLSASRGFTPETLAGIKSLSCDPNLLALASGSTPVVLWTGQNKSEDHLSRVLQNVCSDEKCSMIFLPIRVSGESLGVFNAGFTSSNPVTADTMRLFTLLVKRAALSIENSRLFEQTKEIAILEERNRLARDLHDSAKQKAFAAMAQLGTANRFLKNNNPAAINHMTEAENLIYEVIQELTIVIQEMYPLALKEKGLPVTLREYIYEWENRNEINVQLNIQEETRLPLHVEQAVYRIIQEAMANVTRHSRATSVSINLKYGTDFLDIQIKDNGCGFDTHSRPHGMGLRSIHERAEYIGGSVLLVSAPEEGTQITVRIPIPRTGESS